MYWLFEKQSEHYNAILNAWCSKRDTTKQYMTLYGVYMCVCVRMI